MRTLQRPGETYVTVNYIPRFWSFIRHWDDRTDLYGQRNYLVEPPLVRIAGLPDPAAPSHLLTYWHPKFMEVIDPGVRRLTELLVTRLGCVTYDSCEGHATESPEDISLRYVSIACRNQAERNYLERVLGDVTRHHASLSTGAVHVVTQPGFIDTDDGDRADTIDVLFTIDVAALDRYFMDLDHSYDGLCSLLERLPSSAN